MPTYDQYDNLGNRTGEIRSRDYEYGDWSPSSSSPSGMTGPATFLTVATGILILWSAWFIFRYAITLFFNGPGVTWAGPNRGNYGNNGAGMLLIVVVIAYIVAEFFFMTVLFGEVGGRIHFGHALVVSCLVGFLPVLIVAKGLSSHSGLFIDPTYLRHVVHLLRSHL